MTRIRKQWASAEGAASTGFGLDTSESADGSNPVYHLAEKLKEARLCVRGLQDSLASLKRVAVELSAREKEVQQLRDENDSLKQEFSIKEGDYRLEIEALETSLGMASPSFWRDTIHQPAQDEYETLKGSLLESGVESWSVEQIKDLVGAFAMKFHKTVSAWAYGFRPDPSESYSPLLVVSSMNVYGQILRSVTAEIIVCKGLAQCIFVDVPSKPSQTPSPTPELEGVARSQTITKALRPTRRMFGEQAACLDELEGLLCEAMDLWGRLRESGHRPRAQTPIHDIVYQGETSQYRMYGARRGGAGSGGSEVRRPSVFALFPIITLGEDMVFSGKWLWSDQKHFYDALEYAQRLEEGTGNSPAD